MLYLDRKLFLTEKCSCFLIQLKNFPLVSPDVVVPDVLKDFISEFFSFKVHFTFFWKRKVKEKLSFNFVLGDSKSGVWILTTTKNSNMWDWKSKNLYMGRCVEHSWYFLGHEIAQLEIVVCLCILHPSMHHQSLQLQGNSYKLFLKMTHGFSGTALKFEGWFLPTFVTISFDLSF